MHRAIGFKAVDFATAIYATLLIVTTAIFVWTHVSSIPYWDQWEFIIYASKNEEKLLSLYYLFSAHNEHIIATSKIIYYIDLFLYGGRNLLSIATIYATAIAIALCFSIVSAFDFITTAYQRVALWLAVAACTTALVQWENLIWGFQPQFYLVILGVLLTIMLSYRHAKTGDKASLAGLAITIPFSIFSMGSGVLVVVPIIFLLVVLRAGRQAIGPIVLLVIFIAIFAWIVPGATAIGNPELRTPQNLLLFFWAMIGGPLSPQVPLAIGCGLLATLCFAAWGAAFVLRPWLRHEHLDRGNLILAAFAMYLFATAGAAAYARVTLGIGAALASRYATPMIMIWLILITLLFRTLGRRSGSYLKPGLALTVVAFATFLNTNGDSRTRIQDRFSSLEEAAFSAASGVETDTALNKLYPDPDRIRLALAFLRQRRFSIFADKVASAPADLAIAGPGSVQESCTLAHVDGIDAVSESALNVRGWIAHPVDKRSPDLVLAFATDGSLLGLTTPLTDRPDVASAIRRRDGFRGFTIPVNLARGGVSPAGLTVVAVFNGLRSMMCKLISTADLPFIRPLSGTQPASTELDVETSLDGETATPGLSPVAASRAPAPGATVHGTFVNGDRSQGRISFTIQESAHQCKDVLLPIMHGPTSQTMGIAVTFPDGASEQVRLSSTPHIWSHYLIPGSRVCQSGHGPLRISVTDASSKWGAWVASARPRRRD